MGKREMMKKIWRGICAFVTAFGTKKFGHIREAPKSQCSTLSRRGLGGSTKKEKSEEGRGALHSGLKTTIM